MSGKMRGYKPGKSVKLPASTHRIIAVACAFTAAALLLFVRTSYMASNTIAKRDCSPSWPSAKQAGQKVKIAMVSLSHTPDKGKCVYNCGRKWGGVMEQTRPNKESYVKRRGYDFIDASQLYNKSRPASWSKILAVQAHLSEYDWVFWLDADTVITNLDVEIESIVAAEGGPDLIITTDGAGYNAGVWILRNSTWSASFLSTWWGMEGFVRRNPGDPRSGDNFALQHYLDHLGKEEFASRVGVAPQCAFNSYLWRPSSDMWIRYVWDPVSVTAGTYKQGDFLLHLAGWNDKGSKVEQYMPREEAPVTAQKAPEAAAVPAP